MGRMIKSAFLLGVAILVVQSFPDIARYLKMREMSRPDDRA
jgi:Family of unknown function (DUF6893)